MGKEPKAPSRDVPSLENPSHYGGYYFTLRPDRPPVLAEFPGPSEGEALADALLTLESAAAPLLKLVFKHRQKHLATEKAPIKHPGESARF